MLILAILRFYCRCTFPGRFSCWKLVCWQCRVHGNLYVYIVKLQHFTYVPSLLASSAGISMGLTCEWVFEKNSHQTFPDHPVLPVRFLRRRLLRYVVWFLLSFKNVFMLLAGRCYCLPESSS